MFATPDPLVKTYRSPVLADQFTKDNPTFKGRVYAVRKGDEVEVKLIFASIASVFQFIISLLVNSKNTFLSTKKINQVVNELSATTVKTASLANQITSTNNSTTNSTKLPSINSLEIEVAELHDSKEAQINEFKEKYYNFIDQSFPFLEGWLANLKELKKDADPNMIAYLKEEVNDIRQMIKRKQRDVKEFAVFKDQPNYKEALRNIRSSFRTLNKDLETFQNQLVPKRRWLKSTPTSVVAGIQNAGNSCYMNSALQGLLASPVIIDRIKNYNKNPVPRHEQFMPTLQRFLVAYQHNSSQAIGECASQLRWELFHSRLQNLDVNDVYDMADADLIVRVLGETLDIEYPLTTRRCATSAVSETGAVLNEPFISDVVSYQLLWNETQTSGGPNELSLQEYFTQDCLLALEEHDLGWRTTAQDGSPVIVDEATTSYRIDGPPPPILVFKVGKSEGRGMDAPFTAYDAQPRDEFLDATAAFDAPPEDGAKYRLIAMLVNHGRAHWTAVTRRENGWYNCNDSVVRYIGQEIPRTNAAVMIYERIGVVA